MWASEPKAEHEYLHLEWTGESMSGNLDRVPPDSKASGLVSPCLGNLTPPAGSAPPIQPGTSDLSHLATASAAPPPTQLQHILALSCVVSPLLSC